MDSLARRPVTLLLLCALVGAYATVNGTPGATFDAAGAWYVTAFTYTVSHQDAWHLAGNALLLSSAGWQLERAIGAWPMLAVAGTSAAAGAGAHAAVDDTTLIGASAVAYALAATLFALVATAGTQAGRQRTYARMLLTAWVAWTAVEVAWQVADSAGTSGAAHAGGLAVGLAAAWLRRRGWQPRNATTARTARCRTLTVKQPKADTWPDAPGDDAAAGCATAR